MLKNLRFLVLALFFTTTVFGQNGVIRGRVRNFQTTAYIPGATVTLQSLQDTTNTVTSVSDSAGRFQFNDLQPDSFTLSITSIGFTRFTRVVKSDSAAVDLGSIDLRTTSDVLAGVTVTATVPMAVQKADTVQYNASQFKVNPDASAEDLVKKMPGITSENGTVTAHGETVQKVTIDGRELFGDDATAALRNLPAEIIDKIQVFDRLSDQAQFTGFDDGNSQKGINIITKANMRNGQFGRIFAGYGTDGTYQAGGNSTILKGDRKISLVGNFNNINAQNFASQDLLGVTSGGGGGGGFNRGGGGGGRGGGGPRGGGGQQGGGGFGNNSTFLVAQQNGINKTSAAGINYSDNWGQKLIVTGSYFFNNVNNNTDQAVNTQYLSKVIQNTNQNTLSNSGNTNNRLNMRIEYKIDSSNQLIITPALSFQNNHSARNAITSFLDQGTGSLTHRTINNNNSTTSGNSLNNNLLYRHSFKKRGRTFSVNLSTSSNDRNGDVYTNLQDSALATGYTDSISHRYTKQASNGYQLGANIIYTEPLGKMSQLQLNYNPTYSKSKADQEAYVDEDLSNKYSLFDSRLSSKFDNTYSTQNGGIGYRYGNRDNQLSFGFNYQRSNLHSDQTFPRALTVDKSYNNILPNLMARIKLSTRSNLRIFYRSNVNQPSVTQLQDVYDITNSPFITAGNPQLNQQFTNFVSTRYTYTNPGKGILFVGNVFVQTANNYITNATFSPLKDSVLTSDLILQRGQQLTKPVNVNGYLNVRSFLNFAFPVKLIKSNINLNGGVSYSKLPGIINNVTNLTKNTTYTAGAVIASNISQYVDFTISYSANISQVDNQLQPTLNTNYFSQVAGIQLNLLSKTGWFFQNQLNNQLYSGLAAGYNQNYYLWNLAAGKKFLKNQKGELKLSVFDLLKQNRSITRNVTETYIEDVQNRVLQQYFMLTFTYNLRNFGAGIMNTNRQNRNFGPRF